MSSAAAWSLLLAITLFSVMLAGFIYVLRGGAEDAEAEED